MPNSGNSSYVDPFIGNDTTRLPPPEGIASHWWCAKPPVGNTHPGATLPFGMVSICAYSGAYFMTMEERRELSGRAKKFALNFDRAAILNNLITRSQAVTS